MNNAPIHRTIRIALEESITWVPNITGIGRYNHILSEGIRDLARMQGTNIEILIVSHPRFLTHLNFGPLRRILYLVWLNLFFPLWVKKEKIDIVHHTNAIGPCLFKTASTLVTIHDMGYLKANDSPYAYRWYRHLLTLGTCRLADTLITISETAARDIRELLPTAAPKVKVVYHGVDACFTPHVSYPEGDQRLLLMVGPLKTRKNHSVAIRAFAKLCQHSTRYTMVIAGEKAYFYDELRRLVEVLGLSKKVRFIGYVPDDEFPALYRQAHLLLFPSIFEGFGYPIIEAMASGVPVIASPISSSKEIGGDAVVYAPPDNVGEWYLKILDFDNAEYYRKRVSCGLARAALFTQKDEALETFKLYMNLAYR